MKKVLIIGGQVGCISPDLIDRLESLHNDVVIVHENAQLPKELLEAISDTKKDEDRTKKDFVVTPVKTYDMPVFYSEKKGKHNPKSKSKYLWRK